jgi:hypothetical protein
VAAESDQPNHTEKSDEESDEAVEPIILESAHRHGVADDDMLHALRFAVGHIRQADHMVMFIGPDRAGTLVEVGVVIWWGGELAIAHALRPARTKYLR